MKRLQGIEENFCFRNGISNLKAKNALNLISDLKDLETFEGEYLHPIVK
jgi:hypothetical protein